MLGHADLVYTYDLAGRRASVSGSLASTQMPAAVASAVYNANNQLTQWGTTQMTYDLNGNTLNDGMNSYTWDARNRLISANNNGAVFAYDPFGRRSGKNILSANTNFLYDGANPVQELTGTTPTANLLTGGIDEYFTRTDSNGTANYLTDALGSTVGLADQAGNLPVQYSYSPFGSISITGTTNNSFTYTGREIDGLGLYYSRARYYNPAVGRFISEDPIGLRGGINEYSYVGDSPLNFIDPFGLDKKNPVCSSGGQPNSLPHSMGWYAGFEYTDSLTGPPISYQPTWGNFKSISRDYGEFYSNTSGRPYGAAGLYAGMGAGVLLSNANNVSQLQLTSTTYTVSLLVGSVSFSSGSGIWALQVSPLGIGGLGAVSKTSGTTKILNNTQPCPTY